MPREPTNTWCYRIGSQNFCPVSQTVQPNNWLSGGGKVFLCNIHWFLWYTPSSWPISSYPSTVINMELGREVHWLHHTNSNTQSRKMWNHQSLSVLLKTAHYFKQTFKIMLSYGSLKQQVNVNPIDKYFTFHNERSVSPNSYVMIANNAPFSSLIMANFHLYIY